MSGPKDNRKMAFSSIRIDLNSHETFKFIEIYSSHECLWDSSSPLYSKRDRRSFALKDMAKKMNNGMTEEQISKKIASLRTCYSRELKKIKDLEKNGFTSKDSYKPKWKFFDVLDSFLRPSVNQRIAFSDTSTVKKKGQERTAKRVVVPDSLRVSGKEYSQTHELKLDECLAGSTSINRPLKRETCDVDALHALPDFKRSKNEKTIRRTSTEIDPDEIFGKHIGEMMKSIPPGKKKQKLQLKLQSFIIDEMTDDEVDDEE